MEISKDENLKVKITQFLKVLQYLKQQNDKLAFIFSISKETLVEIFQHLLQIQTFNLNSLDFFELNLYSQWEEKGWDFFSFIKSSGLTSSSINSKEEELRTHLIQFQNLFKEIRNDFIQKLSENQCIDEIINEEELKKDSVRFEKTVYSFSFHDSKVSRTISLEIMERKKNFDLQILGSSFQFKYQIDNDTIGQGLWKGSNLLCHYLLHNSDQIRGKTILELGSGLGLPSLLSACLGAAKVLITDHDPFLLNLIKLNISLNQSKFHSLCQFINVENLDYGLSSQSLTQFLSPSLQQVFPLGFDIILGADVLYVTSSVEPLFYVVDLLLSKSNPNSTFILTHEKRNSLVVGSKLIEEQDDSVLELIKVTADKMNFKINPIKEEDVDPNLICFLITRKV